MRPLSAIMGLIRRLPWHITGFIAVGWIALWLTVIAGFIAQDAHEPYVAGSPPSGGAAAVSFGIGWRGVAFIFVPPIVLLLLRGLSIRRAPIRR